MSENDKLVLGQYYPLYGINHGIMWSNLLALNPPGENPPVLYDYASAPDTAAQVAQAKAIGIDAFLCSWQRSAIDWRKVGWELLQTACEADGSFKACIAFETKNANATYSQTDPIDMAVVAEWLTYIWNNYVSSPSYLTQDGKPVIFMYYCWWQTAPNPDYPTLQEWADTLNALRADGIDFYYMCMPEGTYTTAWLSTATFDGIAPINPFDWNEIGKAHCASWKTACAAAGKTWSIPILPGGGGALLPRQNGGRYELHYTWMMDATRKPDWLMLNAWNNYMDGERTEVQPTVQHGELYYNMTKQFIHYFKQTREPCVRNSIARTCPATRQSITRQH